MHTQYKISHHNVPFEIFSRLPVIYPQVALKEVTGTYWFSYDQESHFGEVWFLMDDDIEEFEAWIKSKGEEE